MKSIYIIKQYQSFTDWDREAIYAFSSRELADKACEKLNKEYLEGGKTVEEARESYDSGFTAHFYEVETLAVESTIPDNL